MTTYSPVLLLSVNAAPPTLNADDSTLLDIPRGQVDYLSHEWREEDVWRSWRNMTKVKNEIANGVRLENASWRTWWKQRNKLKTVTPETLNWLKDSDVTWLYGPLHTADYSPPPKPSPPPSRPSPTHSSSSSDVSHSPAPSGITTKKPILKHRSICDLLTSDLLSSPLFSPPDTEDERESRGSDKDRPKNTGNKRPALLHTNSDTHIIRWTNHVYRKDSPPRIAHTVPPAPSSNSSSGSGRVGSTVPSRINSATSLDGIEEAQPKKKHISFNTFVEQCIAIEKPEKSSRRGYQYPRGYGGRYTPDGSGYDSRAPNGYGNALPNAYPAGYNGGYLPTAPAGTGAYETYVFEEDDGYDEDEEDEAEAEGLVFGTDSRPSRARSSSSSSTSSSSSASSTRTIGPYSTTPTATRSRFEIDGEDEDIHPREEDDEEDEEDDDVIEMRCSHPTPRKSPRTPPSNSPYPPYSHQQHQQQSQQHPSHVYPGAYPHPHPVPRTSSHQQLPHSQPSSPPTQQSHFQYRKHSYTYMSMRPQEELVTIALIAPTVLKTRGEDDDYADDDDEYCVDDDGFGRGYRGHAYTGVNDRRRVDAGAGYEEWDGWVDRAAVSGSVDGTRVSVDANVLSGKATGDLSPPTTSGARESRVDVKRSRRDRSTGASDTNESKRERGRERDHDSIDAVELVFVPPWCARGEYGYSYGEEGVGVGVYSEMDYPGMQYPYLPQGQQQEVEAYMAEEQNYPPQPYPPYRMDSGGEGKVVERRDEPNVLLAGESSSAITLSASPETMLMQESRREIVVTLNGGSVDVRAGKNSRSRSKSRSKSRSRSRTPSPIALIDGISTSTPVPVPALGKSPSPSSSLLSPPEVHSRGRTDERISSSPKFSTDDQPQRGRSVSRTSSWSERDRAAGYGMPVGVGAAIGGSGGSLSPDYAGLGIAGYRGRGQRENQSQSQSQWGGEGERRGRDRTTRRAGSAQSLSDSASPSVSPVSLREDAAVKPVGDVKQPLVIPEPVIPTSTLPIPVPIPQKSASAPKLPVLATQPSPVVTSTAQEATLPTPTDPTPEILKAEQERISRHPTPANSPVATMKPVLPPGRIASADRSRSPSQPSVGSPTLINAEASWAAGPTTTPPRKVSSPSRSSARGTARSPIRAGAVGMDDAQTGTLVSRAVEIMSTAGAYFGAFWSGAGPAANVPIHDS